MLFNDKLPPQWRLSRQEICPPQQMNACAKCFYPRTQQASLQAFSLHHSSSTKRQTE